MNKEQKCKAFRENIISLSLGIIVGFCANLVWQELFFPISFMNHRVMTNENLELLQAETNEKLLTYIEGKWVSSIGDLIVNVEDSNINGSFVVIEDISKVPKRQEKYKIVSIEKVDGIFGIVKLTLCSENKPCDENNFIPIQLNKIFGLKRTITMKFDTRFSFCINKTECIRAFKEAE